MVESSNTFDVRQLRGLAFKPQRIADAVPRDAGRETALLGAIDRRRNVDAQSQIGFLRPRSRNPPAATRLSKTAATVVGASRPLMTASKSGVTSRFQCAVGFISLRRPQRAAVNRVAQIHGLERDRHFQKLAQLWPARPRRSCPCWPSRRRRSRRENFRRCRNDGACWSCASPLPPSGFNALVMRPRPILVLARSSL